MSDDHAHAADVLDPDEPQTPWWMPLLGGLLFLVAGIVAVALSGGEADDTGAPEAAQAEAAAEDHSGHGHD